MLIHALPLLPTSVVVVASPPPPPPPPSCPPRVFDDSAGEPATTRGLSRESSSSFASPASPSDRRALVRTRAHAPPTCRMIAPRSSTLLATGGGGLDEVIPRGPELVSFPSAAPTPPRPAAD
eukprot:30827-Pelagococcus_subviridis.AAC.6